MSLYKDKYFEYDSSKTNNYRYLPEWSTITSCPKGFEILSKLKICYYLKTPLQYLINLEMSKIFDDILMFAFILLFLGFILMSIYSIFKDKKKPLKELRIKFKRSTDAIVYILRAFWILKDIKIQNTLLEEDSKKIDKLMKNNYNDSLDGLFIDGLTSDTDIQIDESPKNKYTNTEELAKYVSEAEGDLKKGTSNRNLHLQSTSNKTKTRKITKNEKNLSASASESYKSQKSKIENDVPSTPRNSGIFSKRKFRLFDGKTRI